MQWLFNSVGRLQYGLMYWMLRAWWFVVRPTTRSTAVALWYRGKVLLVRRSGRHGLSLPGGFVGLGASSNQTVRRWLDRELGIRLTEEKLWLAWHGTLRFESRLDTMDIWEVFLETPPRMRFDGRRITWTGWLTPSTAMKKRLAPSVMLYIFGRSGELTMDKSLSWAQTVEFPAL